MMHYSGAIIGRQKEREQLDKLIKSELPEFLALYGRRRVGKTFLIRQHLYQNIVFDLSGTKSGSKTQQLENFFAEYLHRTQGKQKTKMPKTWFEAFAYLADYLYIQAQRDHKCVVFLDEMPWMDTPRSGFVSALEFFWNQHVSRMNHVLLVACGSASSWIRKNLIKARGGLYNRVTQRIKLSPFNLFETKAFLEHQGVRLPNYQILELYMVMGGIPFYLKEVDKGKSVAQVIDEVCFSELGLLREEYEQLYYSLFKHAARHVSIVEALAAKPQGLTRQDLLHATSLTATHLHRALEELVEADFIARYTPFSQKKKGAIYKLTDYYSLFYLRFIKPHKTSGQHIWEQLSQRTTYTTWSGYAFENICLQHIDQIKSALGIRGVFTQHSAWKFKGDDILPGAQIDLVIDRADQIIMLCEAKFTAGNFAIDKAYANKLRMRKSIFQQATQTKKAIFNILLTTYPAVQNTYYAEIVDNEINQEQLFAF